MGKGELSIFPIDQDTLDMSMICMIWCDNLGEENTWETRIEQATEYFRNKYGEPAMVIVPNGVKVSGNGLIIREEGYCPAAHLVVCMKRIDDEKQAVR